MSDDEPKSWKTLREELLSTPEGRARYARARRRLNRHLRFYAHWEAVKRKLGRGA